YQRRGPYLEDLVQEGQFGLRRAIDKFDPERGYRFATYAVWWIRQSIERALISLAGAVRLPIHVYDSVRHLTDEETRLAAELGRPPTDDEVGARIGRRPEQLRAFRRRARSPLSLATPVGVEDSVLADLIPGGDSTEDEALRDLLEPAVAGVLMELAP